MIVRGRHYSSGDVLDFDLEGGVIQGIRVPDHAAPALGGDDYWVAPGLIDIQVNGYQGIGFGHGDLTVEQMVRATVALADGGVTSFCPTVTTNSLETMEASIRTIAKAIKTSREVRERVLGIHIEGPYISSEEGPRGAHPLEHIRIPDWDEFSRLVSAGEGNVRIVTLSPEHPKAPEFINKAARAGLVVAIGHHGATRDQIRAAVAAGAVLSTHLGNGSHAQLPRHPNYIWEQLANDSLLASIIVDGYHLPPAVVKSFYRAKGSGRLIIVSDAVSIAGLPPGKYQLHGKEVDLVAGEVVRLTGTPYLAGAIVKMCDAVNNMVRFAGASMAEAVSMATTNPARLLQVEGDRARLAVGWKADLVLFRGEPGSLKLAATISGGEVSYKN